MELRHQRTACSLIFSIACLFFLVSVAPRTVQAQGCTDVRWPDLNTPHSLSFLFSGWGLGAGTGAVIPPPNCPEMRNNGTPNTAPFYVFDDHGYPLPWDTTAATFGSSTRQVCLQWSADPVHPGCEDWGTEGAYWSETYVPPIDTRQFYDLSYPFDDYGWYPYSDNPRVSVLRGIKNSGQLTVEMGYQDDPNNVVASIPVSTDFPHIKVITVGGLFSSKQSKIFDWVDSQINNNPLIDANTIRIPIGIHLHSIRKIATTLRQTIEDQFGAGNRVLVIGHSLGSAIAYNVVKEFND